MPVPQAAFDHAGLILLAGTPLDFRTYGLWSSFESNMPDRHHGCGLSQCGLMNRDFDYGLVSNIKSIVEAMCQASKRDTTGKHDAFINMLREGDAHR
jgi:thiamine pyrophosphate-dependent acetolactate synthase large subunit-like protein